MDLATATKTPEPAVTPTPRGVVARLRYADPLTGLACAAALAVYLLHGFDGYLSRDVGVYAYGGQQVAEGVPPYVAIVNRAGPLAHLVPGIGAAAARVVGADELLGMRVLFMLLSVACIGLVQVLGRDLFGRRLAGPAAAAALLCFEGFTRYATYGPREKTTMVLFLLAALLAIVHRRWFAAGVFIALGTLTWQPVFFAVIVAVVVAVLAGPPSGRLRALGAVVVGGLVPTLATVGYYAAIGELHVFLDDFLIINARYTEQSALSSLPAWGWDLLVNGYGSSAWVFVVGLVALPALGVRRALRRDHRADPRTAALLGTVAGLLAALVWSVDDFNGWPDAFLLLPFAALGVGGLAALLAELLPARAALAATLAWVLVATTMALTYSVGARDDRLAQQRASVDTLQALLPRDAGIMSVGAPQALVLAHQRNPSRFQLFDNGLVDYLDATWPGGRRGYGRWIVDDRRPTVIAMGHGKVPGWLAAAGLPDTYARVGRAQGWAWYVRRDVGPGTVAALRQALHQPT